ncbi:MAG: PQQ-dependent sugar dehydrogenase [Bryobacteraceae bacterium]|nr:PQQ-dependent sugar dehydrogenase [Bryobacteraceae bacterium]MDW8379447.1 PQQ-dependent sugar dehydrogenase [Bryobacterales bacterium]
MKRSGLFLVFLFWLACDSAAYAQLAAPRQFRIEELRTPPGFEVTVYATVGGAPRHMAFGPNGVLYVAARNGGNIVAIPEQGRTVVALRGLNGPHSLVFRNQELWVAVNDGVLRFSDPTPEDLVIRSPARRVLTAPAGGQHSTRTLVIDAEGKLYLSIGSTCNFCVESDRRRAAIVQYNPDGSGERLFATGLRNTVGFTFHPLTGQMWGVDHGGDHLGDDEPPEEINLIEEGKDYGWPDCIGKQRPLRWGPQARTDRCSETIAPEFEMQAHAAPLGIEFYTGDQFPASYRYDALVTFHGSWNRTQPTGYKVVRIRMKDGKPVSQEDFLWGFLDLTTRTRSGRPVHAITGPDGAVYVSDDGNGNIYRVRYLGPRINEGGIARVTENIYAMYGQRLSIDGGPVRVFANGFTCEILYAGENQVNFVLPETLRGEVTIRIENERAADEQTITVE